MYSAFSKSFFVSVTPECRSRVPFNPDPVVDFVWEWEIKQEEVARAVSTSQSTISRVLNGRIAPEIGLVVRLADYCGLPFPVLVRHGERLRAARTLPGIAGLPCEVEALFARAYLAESEDRPQEAAQFLDLAVAYEGGILSYGA